MAALTAQRNTVKLGTKSHPEILEIPVKANTKIHAGSLVVIDAGYAAPGRAATGLIAAGRALDTYDNTGGAAGAIIARVEPGQFKWANSASGDLIAQADLGKTVYIVDDQTVAKTDGTGARSAAGKVTKVDADGVFVLTQL